MPADPPELFVVTCGDHGRAWSAPRPLASERLAWASPYGRIARRADGALRLAADGPPRGAAASDRFDAIILISPLEHPADRCVLAGSGQLLLTFGRRRRPLGVGARTSTDGGRPGTPPTRFPRLDLPGTD